MLNEELKMEYLNAVCMNAPESRRTVYINKMKRLSQNIEVVFNKDFCNISFGEYQAFFTSGAYSDTRTAGNDLRFISNYIEWCFYNNKFPRVMNNAQLLLKQLKPTDIVKGAIRNKILFSPAELIDYIDILCSGSSKYYLFMPVSILLFSGVSFDEIHLIKRDDVDNLAMTIHFNDVILDIPHEFQLHVNRILNREKKVEVFAFRTDDSRSYTMYDAYPDMFCTVYNHTGIPPSNSIQKSYTVSLSTAKAAVDTGVKKIGPLDIAISGLFYRLNKNKYTDLNNPLAQQFLLRFNNSGNKMKELTLLYSEYLDSINK